MAGSEGSAAFAEGVPCWIDAQLPDVEAGKRFYGELFGWTFEPFDKTEEPTGPSPGAPRSSAAPGDPGSPGSLESPAPAAYAGPSPYAGSVRAHLDGEPVAALVPKRDGRMPTVWTVYFATPDAEDLADRIREAGGQVITAPVPVGPYGTMALAADPESAVFGLWEGGTLPGFGKRHGPGSFSWVELYARDTLSPTPSTPASSTTPSSAPAPPATSAGSWSPRPSRPRCRPTSSSTSGWTTARHSSARSCGSADGSRRRLSTPRTGAWRSSRTTRGRPLPCCKLEIRGASVLKGVRTACAKLRKASKNTGRR